MTIQSHLLLTIQYIIMTFISQMQKLLTIKLIFLFNRYSETGDRNISSDPKRVLGKILRHSRF